MATPGILGAAPTSTSKTCLRSWSRCPAHDLATFFTTATVNGQPVPHEHRVALFRQLFEAGADTTMNTMTTAIKAFTDYPDQWQILLDDRSLIPNAVEEMLRWASVVAYFRRTATCDVELGGQKIHELYSVLGDVVRLCESRRGGLRPR